ncbi:MAG: AAA family ATPase [Planctomycetota bacterium]|nr:AAA family ATPase [Planctomycetota bacterium]
MPLLSRKRLHRLEANALPVVDINQAIPIPATLTLEQAAEHAKFKKLDACDIVGRLKTREAVLHWLDKAPKFCTHRIESKIVSLHRLQKYYPNLRPPLIHGLLRRGEVMNLIGSPKTGKSAMAQSLMMAVISGGMFLGKFQCERGRVLDVDNELHLETLVHRNIAVCKALNIAPEQAAKVIDLIPLRGELVDLVRLEKEFEAIRPGSYAVIILDAFYKMFPGDLDENSNADMASLYNLIDHYADCLDTAFVLIHHTSKGLQSDRNITDVGAGAGAQSRAADTHLILRPHDEEGVVVVDAAVRSWPPVPSFCARFTYPTWELAPHADPTMLKRGGASIRRDAEKAARDADKEQDRANRERALDGLLLAVSPPKTVYQIYEIGLQLGLDAGNWSQPKVRRLVGEWCAKRRLRQVDPGGGRNAATFECIPPASTAGSPTEPPPVSAAVPADGASDIPI